MLSRFLEPTPTHTTPPITAQTANRNIAKFCMVTHQGNIFGPIEAFRDRRSQIHLWPVAGTPTVQTKAM